MSWAFSGATAFNQSIGAWKTEKVTNMSYMFFQARSFDRPVEAWNVAKVTNMSGMFYLAAAFNQSIGTWSLHSNANLWEMLYSSGMDCASYSATLIGWANNPATPPGRSLGAQGRQYGTNAAAARTTLTTTKGWKITGDAPSGAECLPPSPSDDFVITIKTDNPGFSNSTSCIIQTFSGETYNYKVDWDNDGNFDESGLKGHATHDYGKPGTYTLRIRGTFPRIFCNGEGDTQKLIDVVQWGKNAWSSMNGAFWGCSNLNISATDVPNLNAVTDMSYMFAECSTLNGPSNIDSWNTATVTDMEAMFAAADAFNQSIGSWNTSAVTNMNWAFTLARAFNQPISNWNTAAVTDMSYMFRGASAFNQPISDWNTAKVTDMEGMFLWTHAFNQPIGNWNTAAVTNMSNMFNDATSFNQPIGNWNTAAVTDMNYMFSQASTFNQPIGDWNTAAVTDMSRMFFYATSFDQPIGNWNTSSVTRMGYMFHVAIALNQPIGSWNTAAVTDMAGMFRSAHAFNQPLGTWSLNPAVDMGEMLDDCGMDCANYSSTLAGWANNPLTPTGIALGAADRQYGTNAVAARSILSSDKGWTITGDAPSGADCIAPTPSDAFIITVKTDNPGKSNSTSFTIPTINIGYNYEVDWDNDGIFDEKGITGDATHDYGTAGTYTLRIRGAFPRIFFEEGDNEKLLDVVQWGKIAWATMDGAFASCSNLDVSATDVPDLSNTTGMWNMFYGCKALKGPSNIGNWNTSVVTNMYGMFQATHAFNQPLGKWNTSAVTDMRFMFKDATSFNQPLGTWSLNSAVEMQVMLNDCGMDCINYSSTLAGWANNPVTPTGRSLGAEGMKHGTNAAAARSILINKGWSIIDDSPSGVLCNPNMQPNDGIVNFSPDHLGSTSLGEHDINDPSSLGGHASIQLTVQPNPFNEQTSINVSSDKTYQGRLRITDVSGRVIKDESLVTSPTMTTLIWDASDVYPGIYFVHLETEQGVVVRKVVKE